MALLWKELELSYVLTHTEDIQCHFINNVKDEFFKLNIYLIIVILKITVMMTLKMISVGYLCTVKHKTVFIYNLTPTMSLIFLNVCLFLSLLSAQQIAL